MKKITAILFLLSFFAMSFSKNIVMINFYVNQDAIAAKYCINKYRPSMHCNGHCFLMRQLKKEQQKETKDLGDQFAKYEVVVNNNYIPSLPESSSFSIQTKNYKLYYLSENIVKRQYSLLKPPCA